MITEFPLFVFTTFAGLSIGAYVVNACKPLASDRERMWLFPVVCLALLGVGLLGCLGHLAHPERFLNALANPRAGIAQEAYLSMAFGIVLAVDAVLALRKRESPRALKVTGAVFALVLAFVMGFAYQANLGTPAWTSWATVSLYVLGDVAMGGALRMLFDEKAACSRVLRGAIAVVSVLFAATCVGMALHFASVGEDAALLYAAAVVGIAGAVTLWCKAPASTQWRCIAFAVLFVGVCVARWAFYAACAL